MRIFAKILQALGIVEVMIGLIAGLNGDMWRELYFTLGGIAVFVIGWFVQRRAEKKALGNQGNEVSSPPLLK